jgi:hypothetical protein
LCTQAAGPYFGETSENGVHYLISTLAMIGLEIPEVTVNLIGLGVLAY